MSTSEKELKKHPEITNLFIKKSFIKFQTDKASFINIPNHGNHIGIWLNNIFIYPSKKYEDYVAIGIKKKNEFTVWKYDLDLKRYPFFKISGTDLIEMYKKCKMNSENMRKALFE